METTEFHVDSCVLAVATCKRSLDYIFGEELPTEREIDNFIDRYAVAMKNDSSDDVPSRFENLFRSDILLAT